MIDLAVMSWQILTAGIKKDLAQDQDKQKSLTTNISRKGQKNNEQAVRTC